jgi:uncharacterized protein (DUF1684 family)
VPDDFIALADWRRRIAELYAEVRADPDPAAARVRWTGVRDHLFRSHPQSPVPGDRRSDFPGIPYYPYDPSYRCLGTVRRERGETFEVPTSDDGTMTFTRFGRVTFSLRDAEQSLDLYWLEGYGGGIFLPFRDATSGRATYGAGRYLWDSIKGADLGMEGEWMVLDFNFAYNPSCSYDARWVCPLAPPPNRLDIAIEAGERTG